MVWLGRRPELLMWRFFLSNLCAALLLVAEKRECKSWFLGPLMGAVTVWIFGVFIGNGIEHSNHIFSPVVILYSGNRTPLLVE